MLVLGIIGPMSLGHIDGVIFLVIFAGFIALMIKSALKASKEGNALASEEIEAAEGIQILPMWKSLLYIVGGGAAIMIGGDVVVNSASNIAAKFGMSQTLIGLTIVSIGTSLPELVTSIVAARKDEVDMALGNVIGSNIFNIIILLAFSLLVWLFAFTKKEIKRSEGLIMVLLYALYVVYICIR